MPQTAYKIAILVEKLGNGGAERSAGLLSQILEKRGHRIFMISITNVVEYPYGGHLINLGLLKNQSNGPLNKLKRLQHLKKFLQEEQMDYVIDFRFKKSYLKEYIIAHYLYKNLRFIYAVRSARLDYYFPKNIEKTRKLFSKAFSINAVSEGILTKIESNYGLKNLSFIPNPVDFEAIEHLSTKNPSITEKFIIAAGRMDDGVKQFDLLLKTYAKSTLPKNNVRLKILGKGKLLEEYRALANQLNIQQYVSFEGFKENPFPYFKQALFTVLCSKYEGSPRILLESLACGTPVIALDCPTGPKEIIRHKENGILVAHNDFEALETAMNNFLSDEALRLQCAKNARESISQHSLEKVGKSWEKLLNSAL